jgi:hypothetical protein
MGSVLGVRLAARPFPEEGMRRKCDELQLSVMQAPIVVFSHVQKTVTMVPTGPAADKRLDELLASQREQVSTSGRPAN